MSGCTILTKPYVDTPSRRHGWQTDINQCDHPKERCNIEPDMSDYRAPHSIAQVDSQPRKRFFAHVPFVPESA